MGGGRGGVQPPVIRRDFEFGLRNGVPYIIFPMPDGREAKYTFKPMCFNESVVFDIKVVNRRGYGFGGIVPFYPEEDLDRKFLSRVVRDARFVLVDAANRGRQLVIRLNRKQVEQLRFFIDILTGGGSP